MPECLAEIAPYVQAFRDGSLPRDRWTHTGHLIVGWALLREVGDAARALPVLRAQIEAYNACTGLPAGRRGYHETITAYYLAAIESLDEPRLGTVLLADRCGPDAPGRHWSVSCLASEAARRTVVRADLTPLPWRSHPLFDRTTEPQGS